MKRVLPVLFILVLTLIVIIPLSADSYVSPLPDDSFDERLYAYSSIEGNCAEFDGIEFDESFTFFTPKHIQSDKKPIQSESDGILYYQSSAENGSSDISFSFRDNFPETENTDGTEDIPETFDLFEENIAIDGSSIGIGVFVHSSTNEISRIKCTLTAKGEKGKPYYCEIYVQPNVKTLIFADASPFEYGFSLCEISLNLTAEFSSEKSDGSFYYTVSEPYTCNNADFDVQKQGGLLWLSATAGKVYASNSTIIISSDSSEMSLLAVPREAATLSEKNVYFMVSCSEDTGSITLGEEKSDSANFVTRGISSLITPIKLPSYSGGVIELHFRSADTGSITLNMLNLYFAGTAASSENDITQLSLNDGVLTVKGKVSTKIVSEYSKKQLGLYRISASGDGLTLVDTTPITSRFAFELNSKNQQNTPGDYMYFVSVVDKDAEVLRLTEPEFVHGDSKKIEEPSLFALKNAGAVNVYESGSSAVMITADISKLICPSSNASASVTRGSYVFGINSDYVAELDLQMNFYKSSGVSVYLQLICSEAIPSGSSDETMLTMPQSISGETVINSTLSEGVNMYLSAVGYLAKRYSNIVSFAVGSGIDVFLGENPTATDLYDSAKNSSVLCYLTYRAAAEYNSGVFITVPFSKPSASESVPTEIFSAIFSETVDTMGSLPWVMMYTTSEGRPLEVFENITDHMISNESSVPQHTVVIWEGEDENIYDGYIAFCTSAENTSVKTVFLLDRGSISREVYYNLRMYFTLENQRYFADAKSTDEINGLQSFGSYLLWNFADSHSPLGWSSGYGMSSVSSGVGSNGERVLKCITAGVASDAGIVISSFKSPMNLSDSPYVNFKFTADSGISAVTFIFGSASGRAEYKAELTNGAGSYGFVCDLSDFAYADEINYMAIILYSHESAVFELSKTEIKSASLTAEEIKASLFESEEEHFEIPLRLVAMICLATILLLSIGLRVIILLHRKDKENENAARQKKIGPKNSF